MKKIIFLTLIALATTAKAEYTTLMDCNPKLIAMDGSNLSLVADENGVLSIKFQSVRRTTYKPLQLIHGGTGGLLYAAGPMITVSRSERPTERNKATIIIKYVADGSLKTIYRCQQ